MILSAPSASIIMRQQMQVMSADVMKWMRTLGARLRDIFWHSSMTLLCSFAISTSSAYSLSFCLGVKLSTDPCDSVARMRREYLSKPHQISAELTYFSLNQRADTWSNDIKLTRHMCANPQKQTVATVNCWDGYVARPDRCCKNELEERWPEDVEWKALKRI